MAGTHYVPTPYSYSAAVAAGDTVYLGLHRGFGETFAEQLHGALAGVLGTLEPFSMELADLVKVMVWLKYIEDLPLMEKIMMDYFSEGRYPARMTATTEFFDPDCLVMVEGVAWRPDKP